jgi:hypothetical protein
MVQTSVPQQSLSSEHFWPEAPQHAPLTQL